jgi:hypothetical protein
VGSGDVRDASLGTLDLLVSGLADVINNTLAIALLNVEYLDDVIDDLAEAAHRPRTAADAVIGDVIAAIMRIRDVVRQLNALTGDEDGDAADTVASVLRLLRTEMSQHVELVDHLQGPAPTRVPRRQLATATALAFGEIHRSLIGSHAHLSITIDRRDGQVAIEMQATTDHGGHQLDGAGGSWGAIAALLTGCGGGLALDHRGDGFRVELTVPSAPEP